MIYGALGDIEEYRGMLKGLDVLIDWLEENDPAKLEVGSHPILGDKVFANVMAPTTRPEAEAPMRRISAITTCRSTSRVARPLRLPRAA